MILMLWNNRSKSIGFFCISLLKYTRLSNQIHIFFSSLSFGQPLRSDDTQSKLPSARGLLEDGDSIGVGVFKNPYKEVEDKKIATLEKHVKMVRKTEREPIFNTLD